MRLHVAWMLVFLVPPSLLLLRLPWAVLPIVRIPQGIVFTRVLDLRRFGRRDDARVYLMANELFVVVVAAASAALVTVWRGL